jgi:hypothetical protein
MQGNSDTGTERVTEYDPQRRVYVADYRQTGDRELSVTVVHAVLEVTGADPLDVNLNEAVHPDALNRIFDPPDGGRSGTDGTLTFAFAGCRVTVESSGEIRVDPDP